MLLHLKSGSPNLKNNSILINSIN